MNFALVLSLAILTDRILGDPKNFPHPVKLIGRVINFWQKILFTDKNSFTRGLALCVLTLCTAGLFVFALLYVSKNNFFVQVYLIYSALAWRDLKDETEEIFFALLKNNLDEARKFLSFVVGRDTEKLNAAEITCAVIETISENSIDGIISVIFFAALGNFFFGSYGMILSVWLFKAVSTLDSMIGYESYEKFGFASAKLDDVLNFIPARLGGFIIVMSGRNFFRALKIFLHDRKKHKSPNSAHGESAFAGALNIKLGGGAFYGGIFEPRPFINENAREPEIFDIVRAWNLLDISCALFAVLMIILEI
ncbi:MAG: cobalamin biosynthesis protein CobD [Synergistaceae bacterium]|nr:cobalamin biosynthesis protein CobD [Synergistaceae bacterium]